MKGTFVGANIKGTPAMPAAHVRHDLKRIRQEADVIGVQEFTWHWYWLSAILALGVGKLWSAFPNRFVGLKSPSEGAQAVMWKRSKFAKLKGYVIPAYDFHVDTSHIMRNRYIRAALLRDKRVKNTNGFRAWFLSTHFVVGASDERSSGKRKMLMHQNLASLDKALTHLVKTGYPIMGELDANIHKNGWTYEPFVAMMKRHGAVFHGDLGVEFAFTIDNSYGKFVNVTATTIPTSELYTDHEARVLHWMGVVNDH